MHKKLEFFYNRVSHILWNSIVIEYGIKSIEYQITYDTYDTVENNVE